MGIKNTYEIEPITEKQLGDIIETRLYPMYQFLEVNYPIWKNEEKNTLSNHWLNYYTALKDYNEDQIHKAITKWFRSEECDKVPMPGKLVKIIEQTSNRYNKDAIGKGYGYKLWRLLQNKPSYTRTVMEVILPTNADVDYAANWFKRAMCINELSGYTVRCEGDLCNILSEEEHD